MYILKAMTTRPPNWSNTYFPTYLSTSLRETPFKSDLRDLWLFRHLIEVMKRHDLPTYHVYFQSLFFPMCIFPKWYFAKCILSFASFFSLRWAIYLWHKSCANYLCDDQSLEEIPRSEKIQSLLVQQTTFCIISFGPVQTQTRNVQKPDQNKENYFLVDTLKALSD